MERVAERALVGDPEHEVGTAARILEHPAGGEHRHGSATSRTQYFGNRPWKYRMLSASRSALTVRAVMPPVAPLRRSPFLDPSPSARSSNPHTGEQQGELVRQALVGKIVGELIDDDPRIGHRPRIPGEP